MSTEPDPQLVREIARKAALLAAHRVDDVDTAIDRSGAIGNRPENGPELAAWRQARGALYSAVREEMRRAQVVVSWPDEQAQAGSDVCANCGRDFSLPYVTRQTGTNRCEDCTATCSFPGCGHPDHQRAEQAQDERDTYSAFQTEHAIELVAALADPDPCRLDHHGGCQAHGFLEPEDGERCPHALARAFLAGAGPDRKARQAERDDDVRAVAATLRWIRAEIPPERKLLGAVYSGAWTDLEDRFMDRIAALRERERLPQAKPCYSAVSIGAMPYACVLPEDHDGDHNRVMWHSPGWRAEAKRAALREREQEGGAA